MARSGLFLVFLVTMLLLVADAFAAADTVGGPQATSIDCSGKCASRCSRNWKNEICNEMCNICCKKCSCVPDGPKAPKDSCPCYKNLKNSKGKDKCP